MMGTADPQPSMFYHINLEQYVTADHPMRKIRPLIDTARIRQLCEPLYAETGRPSIPPEQLFLALLGGYLLGVTSERALVRELTGNLVLRWFVGLERRIRSLDAGSEPDQDPGNPTVTFRGERRSNHTHVSTTDPDAKLANKGNGTAAMVGYTVNGLMENRHRLLVGINVETFRGPASERDGGRKLLDTFHAKHDRRIQTVGADKGYFAKPFLTALFRRRIRPHIAAKTTGREAVHQRVRRLSRTVGYRLSQRARKKIEELWGEAKCWHGFRRFQRRGLVQVRDEAYLMGWLLNLKRLATLLPAPA
jgi:hypothetical protein